MDVLCLVAQKKQRRGPANFRSRDLAVRRVKLHPLHDFRIAVQYAGRERGDHQTGRQSIDANAVRRQRNAQAANHRVDGTLAGVIGRMIGLREDAVDRASEQDASRDAISDPALREGLGQEIACINI